MEREAMVVWQFWERWFLTFDLPLLHYNAPHTAACTAASILSTNPNHAPPKGPLRRVAVPLFDPPGA